MNALGQVIDNNVSYDLKIEERGHITYVRYIGIGRTFIIVIDRGGWRDGGICGGLFWVVGKSPSGSLSMMIPRSMIGHLFVTHRSNNTE